MTTIRHVEVVVPARDEQQHIAGCLRSLQDSIGHLRAHRPGVTGAITVVLNCCTDQTPDIVARFGARTLTSESCTVGTARRLGTTDAIDRADVRTGQLWIACTDADTTVPVDWLQRQIEFADAGLDAVIGTVTPGDVSPEIYQRWLQEHDLTEGHSHVHGANLGFRADIYLAAGGFRDDEAGEDVGLVQRIRELTPRWVATHQTSVVTSGRTNARVDGGFGSYMAALEDEAG